MASITDLKIQLQSGTTSTLFASWKFNSTKVTAVDSKLAVGKYARIKSGAKYYNGVDIPEWVFAKEWKITELIDDRAVLGKSKDGASNINSPVKVNDLVGSDYNITVSTKDTLDHYTVTWKYATGDGIWFVGTTEDTKELYSLYDIPSNATKVYVSVKPVAKTYTKGDTERSYWTGKSASATYSESSFLPAVPAAPTVTIKNGQLTAILSDVTDPRTDAIEFQIVHGTTGDAYHSDVYKSITCKVKNRTAACYRVIDAGYYYQVRCRACNGARNVYVYSDWSPYSEAISSMPKPVAGFKCSVHDATSVLLSWYPDMLSSSYEIQYTNDKNLFDKTDVTSVTVTGSIDGINQRLITGLTSGEKWYFRIRSVNDNGSSSWSSIISKIIGTKPSAPTTWSSSTTGVNGEPITFYWIHNSEDGSKVTVSIVETVINGVTDTKVLTHTYDEDLELGDIHSYTIDSPNYPDGTEILWRVKTKGIIAEYSDWSVQRSVIMHAPPTIEISLGEDMHKWLWDTFNFETDSIDTAATGEYIECFPYDIKARSGPNQQGFSNAQFPLCYHVSITAEDTYTTIDEVGNEMTVIAGTVVYAKTVYTSDYDFKIELQADDVILENDQSYKVTVTVSMNSGLSATDSKIFTVNWYQHLYDPDAEIAVDRNSLSVYITPFCFNEYASLNDDIVLSVYRREYDGRFTKIATNLENDAISTIVDPHPALDYGRYRIVARNKNTNVSGFTDIPAIPIKEPSIVIQWDEKWSDFDYTEDAEPVEKPWAGSMLRLPYNVDISEKYAPDVSLIKYVGRENPVAYYGTHRGETATWSTVIPKSDKETIYALRRLSKWMGDVYVREPSGIGYWANITVSMSINHNVLTVPVSFTITRVEGDM